jgi:plasmid stabilization system protein ParE
MGFRVKVLRRASRELDAIAAWIKERSVRGAARWLKAFEAAIARSSDSPLTCSLAPESEGAVEVRQVFFKTPRGRRYRALFVVVDNEIRILHIRGPDQAPLEDIDILDS